MRRFLLAFALCALPALALAQGVPLQGGPWTPGHVPQYVGQGSTQPVIMDGGPAAGGGPGANVSELGIVARGTGAAPFAGQGTGPYGSNLCDYDAPTTNPAGYHFFCFSANAQGGGLLAYGAGGTASNLPLNIILNGVTYAFPFAISGIVGPSTSVVGDPACWNNTTGTLLKDCGPLGGVLTGTLPNPGLAAGAAAANVGALGGDLTGTLPNPTIAAGAVTNAKRANMAAYTVSCNATNASAAPQDCSSVVVQPGPTGGLGTLNPYANVYPPGIAYPNWSALANSAFWSPNGTITVNNPLAWGNLNTAEAASFTVNSSRPGCVNGYTADSEIGAIQEVGAVGLCAQADTIPYLFTSTGTFTSTTFAPTTNLTTVTVTYPFGSPTTATAQSLLQPNMWLVTNDAVPFYGRITAIGTGTSITVGGWYQLGSSIAGTPSGTAVFANPQNYAWAFLPQIFLNQLGTSIGGTFTPPTGNTGNTSTTITGVSSTVGVMVGATISGTNIPAGAVVTGVTASTITISAAATGTATGVTLNIAAIPGDRGAISEFDLSNSGPAFTPLVPVTVTGCTATSGSRTLTGCSTIPASVRNGHAVYTTSPVGIVGDTVVATTSTSVTLNRPATASSGGVSLIFFSIFDEGGVGIDFSSPVNNANTAVSQRGNFSYGYLSHGAKQTSFWVRPDGFAPIPSYGFQFDGTVAGHASVCDLAVSGATDLWCVTGTGDETAHNFSATNTISGSAGPPPTLMSCGTGGTFSTGSNINHGTLTIGSSISSCTILWPATRTNAPDCVVTSPTGTAITSYLTSNAAITVTATLVATNKLSYICLGT